MQNITGPKLAAALCKALAAMPNAIKDANNPHFKSRYATLASVREAVMPHLTANGLCVLQTFDEAPDGEPAVIVLTHILHESGESFTSKLKVPSVDKKPQSVGSAITYGRRFALAAICGIATDDDDDGNGAQGRTVQETPPQARRASDTRPPQQDRQQCASTQPPAGEPAGNAEAWDRLNQHTGGAAPEKPATGPTVKLRDGGPRDTKPANAPAGAPLEPHQRAAANLILKYLTDRGVPPAECPQEAGKMLHAMLPHVTASREITPLDAERIRVCITLLPRVPGNSIADVNQYLNQQLQVQPVHQLNESEIPLVFDALAKGITTHDPLINDDDVPF